MFIEGCTLVGLCVLSECVRLKSGDVSKESLSSPEMERSMDCFFIDEQG